MRKSWGLTKKILTREKNIESRWYQTRRTPWDKIKKGDAVYFKDSGEPVTIKAEIGKVLQFPNLTQEKVKEILKQYGKDDGIEKEKIKEFFERFKTKRYCILIFLKNPRSIKPFEINKKGFGAMSSWITVGALAEIEVG